MTQEEKELLLKDLSGRLPYDVKVQYNNEIYNIDYISALYAEVKLDIPDNYTIGVSEIKPYLRPLSSMNEEESAELSNIISEWFDKELFYLTEEPFLEYALSRINYSISPKLFDWLNKKHFNYRLPEHLYIKVTKENNPYKE